MRNHITAFLEVARQTMRLQLQNRLFAVLVLAQVGAAGLALAIGWFSGKHPSGRELHAIVSWWMLGTVLLPWTTIYFGVQAVHGDIDDRTFQYLFVRPVARATILLGKWLAVALLATAVHVFGTALVFGATLLPPGLWPDGVEWQLLVVFAAAMGLLAFAYSAIAALFAARFRWPLVWAAAFTIVAQMLLANLPAKASIRFATITDPVRRFVFDGIDLDARLARAMWPMEPDWRGDLVGSPLLNLAAIVGIALLLALVSYVRSEYDSRVRE